MHSKIALNWWLAENPYHIQKHPKSHPEHLIFARYLKYPSHLELDSYRMALVLVKDRTGKAYPTRILYRVLRWTIRDLEVDPRIHADTSGKIVEDCEASYMFQFKNMIMRLAHQIQGLRCNMTQELCRIRRLRVDYYSVYLCSMRIKESQSWKKIIKDHLQTSVCVIRRCWHASVNHVNFGPADTKRDS